MTENTLKRAVIMAVAVSMLTLGGGTTATAQSNFKREVPDYFHQFLMQWAIAKEIADNCPDYRLLRNRWRPESDKVVEKLRFDGYSFHQVKQMMRNPKREPINAAWNAYLTGKRKIDISKPAGACKLGALETAEKTKIGKILHKN